MSKEKKSFKKRAQSVVVTGTPTVLFLPARNYKFRVLKDDYKIVIPRRGKYVDIDNEFFTEEDGEFCILDELDDTKDFVFYSPSISKVLFATKLYPKLEDNQAFTPIAFVIGEDEVEILGNVIEMLQEE